MPRQIIENRRKEDDDYKLDQFKLVEDKDYKIHMVNEENEKISLYVVVLHHPHVGGKTVNVLAQSIEDACSQAECTLPNHHNESVLVKSLTVVEAVQVPFLIRGWSKREF